MAIKLTKEVLNKLIMEAIDEGLASGFGFDPSAYERGRGASFSQKGPKMGGPVGDAEQLFNMIQNDPDVPDYIKEFATDVFMPARTPTAKYGSQRVATADLPELPASSISGMDDESVTAKMSADELPTPQFSTAQMRASRRPTVNLGDLADMPSPQATSGPTKGRPEAPELKKPGFFSRLKKAAGLEEQIEQLVSQVLAEMSKEKPTAKKKEDLEGLEAHYGEEMRAGIKGKHSHKSRMAALQAAKKAAK